MAEAGAARVAVAIGALASALLPAGCVSSPGTAPAPSARAAVAPNVVLVVCDDLGYADVPGFGAGPRMPMPALERLAREGMSLDNFHVTQAVCSASRASILTGCYANRVGIHGALGPDSLIALDPAEETIAECLKPAGYATLALGKWHLGCRRPFLPVDQGFDHWYGLPYSNDMSPYRYGGAERGGYPPLMVWEDDRAVRELASVRDQEPITRELTERACRFIAQERGHPFFLYLAHPMPHTPIVASPAFRHAGPKPIDDTLLEIDWSVGQVLRALDDAGVARDTIVAFTSDNGPWLNFGDWAGSALPLREGKGTSFEGGVRVPCIVRWPGHVPAGARSSALVSTLEFLPTVVHACGGRMPVRRIDGVDAMPVLRGDPGASVRDALAVYYEVNDLQAVTDGRFKLVLPHRHRSYLDVPPGRDNQPGPYASARQGLALYDTASDPGETVDVQAGHPAELTRLERAAQAFRADLGDGGVPGPGCRPAAPAR